ncbi:MAG: IPT/TIG domain-containing protein, partial [Deltaproteobacteria bacterium]|nr:IPT/TIG domain-containing protein [Deltaproteobacteria bacterium]
MSRRLAARPFAGPWVVGLALTACVLTACHGSTDVTADAGSNDTDAGAHDGGLTDGGSVDGGTSDGGTSDGGVEVKITALYPAQGPIAGGTQSLLSGAGFVEGIASRGGGAVSKVTELRIGGVLAKDVDVIDDNRISLTTPPGVAGAADVTVTNPNGTGTCTGCFRYLAHVEIDSITPARGPVQGGTAVTVKGLGFDSTLSLTLDGAPLVDLVVVDGTTATGKTPPGVAGAADLLAITKDGNALGHSAFVYADALTLTSVTPSVVPIAGGGALTAHGTGFTAQAALSIEGVSIDTRWIDEETLGFTAPAHAEGAATLTVIDPGALEPQLATLPRALVYVDDSTGTPRPLALAQIAPRTGPVAGGTCPTACVRLLGAGFSVDDLVVTIAGNAVPAASLHLVDDRTLDLDLPAAASAGPVAIEVSSASRSESAQLAASDPGAFRYLPLLSVTRVSPDRAPANGAPATQLSIEGAGFADSAGAPLQVLVGALPLTNVTIAPSGSSLIGNAPHGASGLAAITVIATDTDGYVRTATLADALRFTAPLKLLQLNPSRGSQAGGTGVDLLGDGFEPGMTATLAGTIMSDLTVVSATRATAHTPPGNPGEVAAAVQLATQAATLPAAFNYFDPSANAGGTGGGPLLGDLNVSVLENSLYKDGGVAQATVTVHLHDGSVLTGLTDFRGQITFDDPRLVLPCDVTVTKAQYEGITIVGVAVENVSVYLS